MIGVLLQVAVSDAAECLHAPKVSRNKTQNSQSCIGTEVLVIFLSIDHIRVTYGTGMVRLIGDKAAYDNKDNFLSIKECFFLSQKK